MGETCPHGASTNDKEDQSGSLYTAILLEERNLMIKVVQAYFLLFPVR
jgi:hypothetical protein